MSTTQTHNKKLLAGQGNCTVVLCPECRIVELNLGQSTVRIHPESMPLLVSLLEEAQQQYTALQETSATHDEAKAPVSSRLH